MKAGSNRRYLLGLPVVLGALAIAGCATGTVDGNSNDNEPGADELFDPVVNVGSQFVVALRAGNTSGDNRIDICDGWFPLEPNNTLVISRGLSLSIRATSESELRLHVLCDQSNFCGEQIDEDTWEISRFWNTAVCDVFVGTPEEGGALEYTLDFVAN